MPDPVGPVTRTMPLGSASASRNSAFDRLGHAEHFEVDPGILLVEDAQHDPLAGPARQGRDAHVDQLAAERQPDPPVLRQPPLGDVEPRHHLDPADHHRRDVRRHAQRLAQHAVHPHPHDEAGLIGLDMDVGDALPRGVGDDAVDQPDRRRVVGRVEQIVGARQAAARWPRSSPKPSEPAASAAASVPEAIEIGEQPVEGRPVDLDARANGRARIAAQLDQRLADRRPRASPRRAARRSRRSAAGRGAGRRHRGCGRRAAPAFDRRARSAGLHRRARSSLPAADLRSAASSAGRHHLVAAAARRAARSAARCRDSRGPARRGSARGSGCRAIAGRGHNRSAARSSPAHPRRVRRMVGRMNTIRLVRARAPPARSEQIADAPGCRRAAGSARACAAHCRRAGRRCRRSRHRRR